MAMKSQKMPLAKMVRMSLAKERPCLYEFRLPVVKMATDFVVFKWIEAKAPSEKMVACELYG